MLFLGVMASAQQPQASPRVTAENENVKVAYGQPSKKEELFLGKKKNTERYGGQVPTRLLKSRLPKMARLAVRR